MADLDVAAGAGRNARAALVALAGHDDAGDAASELDRAIVTLADEGHARHLDELLAPAAGAALQGAITYRLDRHERGTLAPTEVEELPDVVVAVRRFLEAAEGLSGDESVLLFSAAEGVDRMLASALAETPVRFHPPEHASFSGDQSAEAFTSWAAQLNQWAEAEAAVPESNGNRRARRDGAESADDAAVLRARIDDLEQQLAEREAELSRLRGELAAARDTGGEERRLSDERPLVDERRPVVALPSRGTGARRALAKVRRSRTRPH